MTFHLDSDNTRYKMKKISTTMLELKSSNYCRGGIPIWFATAMYSFEGIGVILPLENQMKEPKKMVATFGTINISMTLCAIMYLMMGFFGYWHWMDVEIEGSITLNLPEEDWYVFFTLNILRYYLSDFVNKNMIYNLVFKYREAQSTKIVMAIAVFLTYPLQMYPVVEIFLPALQRRFSDRWMVPVELAFRYFLVAITCKLSDVILSYNEYKSEFSMIL